MTVDSSSIGFDSHNVTFIISSQVAADINGTDNLAMVLLMPVVSATLDVLSLYVLHSIPFPKDVLSTCNQRGHKCY